MDERPNIILAVVDCLRYDFLGCYNEKINFTPNIDEIASQSVVFEQAISQAPWTKPSMASLFTALYPKNHGVYGREDILKDEHKTLAEILSSEGYYCVGFCENPYLRPHVGFARGFNKYFTEKHNFLFSLILKILRRFVIGKWKEDLRLAVYAPTPAPKLSQKVIKTIKKIKEPFFAYVHYLDAHQPYGLPEYKVSEELSTIEKRLAYYKNRVARIDKAIGTLVRFIEREKQPFIFVITADHGEEFMEHGGIDHSQKLYEELIHVPLIIYAPTILKPRRIKNLVRTIDIMPTLLDLVETVPPSPNIDGKSLLPLIEDDGRQEVAYSEAGLRDNIEWIVSLRDQDRKIIRYVESGRCEYYDLKKDPGEKKPLKIGSDNRARKLYKLLGDYISYRAESRKSFINEDKDTIEKLKGLGYI